MEIQDMTHSTTLLGTIGGTLLTVVTINSEDIIKTIILASIGAIVSFTISVLLKRVYKYFTNK